MWESSPNILVKILEEARKKHAPKFLIKNRNLRIIANFKYTKKCYSNFKDYKYDNKGNVNSKYKQER